MPAAEPPPSPCRGMEQTSLVAAGLGMQENFIVSRSLSRTLLGETPKGAAVRPLNTFLNENCTHEKKPPRGGFYL